MELTERLRAALDETERVARAAIRHPMDWDPASCTRKPVGVDDGAWRASGYTVESPNTDMRGGICIYDETGCDKGQAIHIALHDPERELRTVAADRKILDWYVDAGKKRQTDEHDQYLYGFEDGLSMAVEAMAERYGVEA